MQLNKDYEPEIDLRAMFFHILYRWRSILIISVITAVLLGGYKYFAAGKEASRIASSFQTQEGVLSSEKESELKRKIGDLSEKVNDLDAYLKESVYIQLNPRGVWTASCKYLVKVDPVGTEEMKGSSVDPVDSILPEYTYPLTNISEEELAGVFGTGKMECVAELVSIATNTDENTITISVKGPTKEAVQKGLNYLRTRVESVAEVNPDILSHTLKPLGTDIELVSDVEDINGDPRIGRKTVLISTLDGYKKELQELQKNADLLSEDGRAKFSKKQAIKFALIGLVAGAFLSICFYAFHYVMRGKLTDGHSLFEQYNLPILGEIKKSSSIHHDRGLDKLISNWELRKQESDTGIVYNNICALIKEHQKVNKVLLVSTLNNDVLMPVREAISSRIKDKEIDTKEDFLSNSETITNAAEAPAVIIIEERNISAYKEIDQMVKMLMISKANVIGAIVL